MKKTTMFFIAGSGLLFMILPVQAQMHEGYAHGQAMAEEAAKDAAGKKAAVEVGNTVCPVSGERIGNMGGAVKVEYNGKIYNLCCPMCKRDFLKNPEKYSAVAEKQAGFKTEGSHSEDSE